MNGWNLTHSVINVSILTCNKTSLDFVNISESVISGRLFLSYNGPERGHLCHTDTFLVSCSTEHEICPAHKCLHANNF